jgi:uncharacterized delta-60 repeat protein/uncharacterized repeat protein (TIGR01451 family)
VANGARGRLLVTLAGLVLAAVTLVAVAGAAAGDLDPTFGSEGIVLTDFGGEDAGAGVAVQPDGKIVAVGFTDEGDYDFALARYSADGSLDASFGSGGKVRTDVGGFDLGAAVVVQPDGKIVAVGESGGRFGLVRYNPDGRLDPGFGAGGKVRTDVDPEASDQGTAVALQPDGKIVVAGTATPYDEDRGDDFAVARYKPDGSLDPTFGSGGKLWTDIRSGAWDLARAVAVQPDGRILVFGDSDRGGSSDFALVRYTADGSLDPTFGFGGSGKVWTNVGSASYDWGFGVLVQPDRRIVVAGFNGDDFALVRYLADGNLDPSFGSGGKVLTDLGGWWDRAEAVVLQPDGKIVAAGQTISDDYVDFALVRYDPGGRLDASFGSGGTVRTDLGAEDRGRAVALQPDGKLVVAGESDAPGGPDFALARYDGGGGTADLTINAIDRPDPVVVNSVLRYEIFVGNNGPAPAAEVVVETSLPAAVTFLSAKASQGACRESDRIVRCELGTVAGDRPGRVTIRVRPTVVGTIRARPSVSAATPDPDRRNNRGAMRTRVVGGVRVPSR